MQPVIALLSICPREMKTYVYKNLYMNVQSICMHNKYPKTGNIPNVLQQVNGLTNCGTYICHENYSAVKGNKLLIHTATWMNIRHNLDQKKPNIKEYIPDNSINIKFNN